ncbi:hypothetical protein [Chryseobacterium gallinarum]|uniref:Uncharacterized protein n=1 Tax=Chryseobacterium gallinarum TaxID=1324352 RepID=A0A0G3M1G8_CHRGL|nr:hypothetical protein [Chryseobacterium gallinarum]AKK71848.1 hypothetical protein OK18_03620 [Chryseobacterium gallinarum]QIY92405.1 hypothetical protein FOB44_17870 [Chryseobacterium gallinarum]
MNDLIIDDLYEIRNYLDQVVDYIKKIKDQKDIFSSSFPETKEHLYEIYNDRLDFSVYQGKYFEGLAETVKRMKHSNLKNVLLSVIDGDKRSCFIFSSEDYSTILGIIFYDN